KMNRTNELLASPIKLGFIVFAFHRIIQYNLTLEPGQGVDHGQAILQGFSTDKLLVHGFPDQKSRQRNSPAKRPASQSNQHIGPERSTHPPEHPSGQL